MSDDEALHSLLLTHVIVEDKRLLELCLHGEVVVFLERHISTHHEGLSFRIELYVDFC